MKSAFIPLAQLFTVTQTIEGRKKCQKIVHILQECGVNFGYDFELALYGAYSSELRTDLEDFVTYHFLVEETKPAGDFKVSCFSAQPKLNEALEGLEEELEPDWAETAKRLNEFSTRKLEGTSTVFFLQSLGFSNDALRTRFEAVKPHLQEDFDDCLEFAGELQR